MSFLENVVQKVGNNITNNIKREIEDTNFGRALRMVGILDGAEPQDDNFSVARAFDQNSKGDWRVRLSLPPTGTFKSSNVLNPLLETNGLVFPYTPSVFVTHSANYNQLQPTHSNYPFHIYSGSQVDQFTITGDFTVENPKEAEYWVAAIHYLRSVTKMAYGESSNKGSPPPVLKLNGYGSFVFNNIPVVVQNFNVTLPNDVDYIPTRMAGEAYAPTRSEIAVALVPQYSRDKVNKFSLDKFVDGGYIGTGQGYL